MCLPSMTAFSAETINSNEEIWETVTYDYVTKAENVERITKTAFKSEVQNKMQTMNLDEEYMLQKNI